MATALRRVGRRLTRLTKEIEQKKRGEKNELSYSLVKEMGLNTNVLLPTYWHVLEESITECLSDVVAILGKNVSESCFSCLVLPDVYVFIQNVSSRSRNRIIFVKRCICRLKTKLILTELVLFCAK